MKEKKFGFNPFSMVDSPNSTISSVVYTLGCNLRCNYCYNNTLVIPELFYQNPKLYSIDEIKSLIQDKRSLNNNNSYFNKSDYIVISGGEPLIHFDDVLDIAIFSSSMGFKVKVNTNATLDLSKLLESKMIDYVSVDLKSPFSKNETPIIKENFAYLQYAKQKKYIHNFEIHTVLVKHFITDEEVLEMSDGLNNLSINSDWYLVGYKHTDTVLSKELSLENRFLESEAKKLYTTALLNYNGKAILSGY